MNKIKLTREEQLKKIRCHKLITLIIMAASSLFFIISIIFNNLYPETEIWLFEHSGATLGFFVTLCIFELFKIRKWGKDPETYNEVPDERDEKINGQICMCVIGVYYVLSVIAAVTTYILSLFDKVSYYIPLFIFLNLAVIALIQILVTAIVKVNEKRGL